LTVGGFATDPHVLPVARGSAHSVPRTLIHNFTKTFLSKDSQFYTKILDVGYIYLNQYGPSKEQKPGFVSIVGAFHKADCHAFGIELSAEPEQLIMSVVV